MNKFKETCFTVLPTDNQYSRCLFLKQTFSPPKTNTPSKFTNLSTNSLKPMSNNHTNSRLPIKRRIKPPHPSPPGHRHRLSTKQSKLIKRCNSEPTLLAMGIPVPGVGVGVGAENHCMSAPGDSSLLFRSRILTDVFSSSPELMPNSPEKSEGYDKEAKVVIKVTVEGSVGPIRALVKLGSSVDETIKIVMNKYNAERRSPTLDQDDMTSFELHHSYFSLQSLDKSNMIGETGSRSFYLRKSVNNNGDMCSRSSIGSGIGVAEGEEASYSFLNILLPCFIHEEFRKMIKRTSRISRLLGCFGV